MRRVCERMRACATDFFRLFSTSSSVRVNSWEPQKWLRGMTSNYDFIQISRKYCSSVRSQTTKHRFWSVRNTTNNEINVSSYALICPYVRPISWWSVLDFSKIWAQKPENLDIGPISRVLGFYFLISHITLRFYLQSLKYGSPNN